MLLVVLVLEYKVIQVASSLVPVGLLDYLGKLRLVLVIAFVVDLVVGLYLHSLLEVFVHVESYHLARRHDLNYCYG